MSVTETSLKQLLKAVNKQFQHQHQLAKIKGETFNIFSILQVEANEVKTHSNFIAELLHPKGSHLLGDVFLKEFLLKIGYTGVFNTKNADVKKEVWLGTKTATTGGYIDIVIIDKKTNQTITIENKIYAGDQDNQLLRYSNYNKGKNTLYYLTLHGNEPSKESASGLVVDKDFYLISYRETLLQWLKRCQEIAIDVPQLREAIKQYYLLIKKLTNQMISAENTELKKLLFENANASQYIADNFQNIKNNIKEEFREQLVNQLRLQLDDSLFSYEYPHKVSGKGIAQIFITLNKLRDKKFQFLIESFSGYGHHNGDMFIGVLDHTQKEKDFPISGEINGFDTNRWKSIQFLKINDERINLENNQFLTLLIDVHSNTYQNVLAQITEQCVAFIKEKYPIIEAYFNKLE